MMDIRGEFELHLTVAADATGVEALAAWARDRAVKFAHIVLARGETASQPMLTTRVSGTLRSALAGADSLAGELARAGMKVVRTKLEAAPDAVGVPRTTEEAKDHPSDRYFEHHIKLLLDSDVDEAALITLVTPHGAHVSRNARRFRVNSRAERFVTQRCHRVGDDAAAARLARLEEALLAEGYEILSVEREFVVYDSAPSVDTGWM